MSPSEKTQPRPGAAEDAERAPGTGAASGAATTALRTDRPPAPATGAATATAAGARTASREDPGTADAPRKVRLTVAHVDPWAVAKLAFLLSVALGIVLVVAVALLWSVVNGMGVFSDLDGVIRDVVGRESTFDLMDYVGLSRVLSVAITLAVVDVVLITVISTLAAVLYNLAGSLVGGLRLTLSDD